MKYIFLLVLVLIGFSCSRGYYNVTQNYYDYDEAYELVHKLTKGTLIVQIPCERRKIQLMTLLFEKEKNLIEKKRLKIELDEFKNKLLIVQKTMISGTEKFYIYSKYAFVPDTLINDFKNGKRENIFIDSALSFKKDISIDTSNIIMFLRSLRDYDDLFIHKSDGKYPPRPFPYASTVPTRDFDRVDFDTKPISKDNTGIYKAIITINERLVGFYEYNKAPD